VLASFGPFDPAALLMKTECASPTSRDRSKTGSRSKEVRRLEYDVVVLLRIFQSCLMGRCLIDTGLDMINELTSTRKQRDERSKVPVLRRLYLRVIPTLGGDATLRTGHWNLDQAIWPTIVSCGMQLIICCLQFQAECVKTGEKGVIRFSSVRMSLGSPAANDAQSDQPNSGARPCPRISSSEVLEI
jgi:hypothetical protein